MSEPAAMLEVVHAVRALVSSLIVNIAVKRMEREARRETHQGGKVLSFSIASKNLDRKSLDFVSPSSFSSFASTAPSP